MFPTVRSIAGLLVSAWIFKAVIGLVLENIKYITGGSADKDIVEQILHITNSVPGVLRCTSW